MAYEICLLIHLGDVNSVRTVEKHGSVRTAMKYMLGILFLTVVMTLRHMESTSDISRSHSVMASVRKARNFFESLWKHGGQRDLGPGIVYARMHAYKYGSISTDQTGCAGTVRDPSDPNRV